MKNYKKVETKARNTWTGEMLQEVLHELDSVPGATIRRVAKKHGLEESTIRNNHHGVFCKSGFLKSRINRGKILIVGNNNKTKEITIKVLTIFIVIVI